MKPSTDNTDTQTLMGASLSNEYLYQDQEAELLAASAEDDFAGYSEWSSELEATAWQGAQQVGDVLIKKACEHTSCCHFQCSKSTRLTGIEI